MKRFENLWIIGNGFDLTCDLKTKYDNFLDWYKNTNYSYKKEALELKKNKRHSKYFKTKHPLSKIFNEPMNINKSTLFSLDYYINNYKSPIIKQFKEKILINDKKKINWSDLELKLGYITRDPFFNNSPEKFGLCIDNLHLALNKYLLNEDKKAELQGAELFKNLNENALKALKTFDSIDIDNTVFIVLNYTKNFERFIKLRYPDKTPFIVYLHGTVYDGNTVLGIGSEYQIFNPNFAQNHKVTQRLLKTEITKGNKRVFYEDFRNFFNKNLNFTRNEVNIFGCSLGGSDMFLWYSFLERILQEGDGIFNVYDINKEYDINNKKCKDLEKAKINEIICSILFFYSSTVDSTKITNDIFMRLISVMEEYINDLEKKIPENNRLLDKYRKYKLNGDISEYLNLIDKYLCKLENEHGKINDKANEVDKLLSDIKEFVSKAEESKHIVNQKEYIKELDKIVSNDDLNEFKETLRILKNTGTLNKPFLGMKLGTHSVNEEPLRTILEQFTQGNDSDIKMLIAQSRGIPVTNLASRATTHTYSFKMLEEYANSECECNLDKAIEEIESLGENGEFVFNKKLIEGNPFNQEPIKNAVKKIKNILVFHSLSTKKKQLRIETP